MYVAIATRYAAKNRASRAHVIGWHLLTKNPAADVVEVVRCRECKYSHEDEIFGNRWCDSHLGCRKVKDDGYCYLGERKEGADND